MLMSPRGSNSDPSSLVNEKSSTTSSNVAVTFPTLLETVSITPFACSKTLLKSRTVLGAFTPFKKSHSSV